MDKTPRFHNAAAHPAADPFVLYDRGQYYAYSTEGADEGYAFAIYSSPDLSTWHKHPGGALRLCHNADMNRTADGEACWARDWLWAPETYHNEKTGWYFLFFAGRLREDLTKDYFRYSAFEEPSKIGVAVSRSPAGPFREIQSRPMEYHPFDPDYHDVNLIMDEEQMLPPQSLEEGKMAPQGTYIPTIDPNVFFDRDGRIYLYTSRNAYRNWNWDTGLRKYVEESNIIAVELSREWWDDPSATTMPEIIAAEKDVYARNAVPLPANITSYNGTGEIGHPPRKDGWTTVISYGADPQGWESFHVNDNQKYNGTRKDRRWSEGSTVITRRSRKDGKPVYLLTYSANNYEAANYGVGYATAGSPLGPFRKSSANPVLSQQQGLVYSTGHGCIVASPPRDVRAKVGAQDVTHQTPDGAELFYIHHARNSTTQARALYTTRMTVNESKIYVGSNGALDMHLTISDQNLPDHTYPLRMTMRCDEKTKEYHVRVESRLDAPFDLQERSNRVIARPGDRLPSSIESAAGGKQGSYTVRFDGQHVSEIVYQRQNADGDWVGLLSEKAL